MKENKKIVFVDLDETLWKISHAFNLKKAEFALEMVKHFQLYNLAPETVLQKFNEIDINDARLKGLAKDRFPKSMVKTYIYFCKEFNETQNFDFIEKIKNLGFSVYETKPILYHDTDIFLNYFLKNKDKYELNVYTAGDRDVQTYKLKITRTFDYFDNIFVVEKKTPDFFLDFIKSRNIQKSNVFMIGNSAFSDIIPAIEAGITPLYIPNESWGYDKIDKELPDIKTFGSLTETILWFKENFEKEENVG